MPPHFLQKQGTLSTDKVRQAPRWFFCRVPGDCLVGDMPTGNGRSATEPFFEPAFYQILMTGTEFLEGFFKPAIDLARRGCVIGRGFL